MNKTFFIELDELRTLEGSQGALIEFKKVFAVLLRLGRTREEIQEALGSLEGSGYIHIIPFRGIKLMPADSEKKATEGINN